MRQLTIVWQRLMTASGATCDRCGLTFDALQRAVKNLNDALAPLNLEPRFETVEIAAESF